MSEEYNKFDNGNDPQENKEPIEDTSYAFSYRKAGEERTEEKEGESFTRTYTDPQKQSTQENTQYNPYHFSAQIPPEPEKKEKKRGKRNASGQKGTGKKFGMVVATAAVFGLVAGSVFVGVSYFGNKFLNKKDIKVESTQLPPGPMEGADPISKKTGSGFTVSEVARNVMPSVVSITGISIQEIPNYFGFGTQQYEIPSSGSGIIVGQNDTELLIATNNHVIKDTNSITVCFTNQDGTAVGSEKLTDTSANQDEEVPSQEEVNLNNAVEAKIKGTDSDNDLAVVAVKLADIPEDVLKQIKVATIGESDSLVIGEQVVAIGNALGYGQSVTSGYVSALNKKVSSENADSTFIQTDAAINPGNSGGALLNMRGELIGINSAKIAEEKVEGMGFAIPISKAQPILDEMMSKKTREKVEDEKKAAYLGVTLKNVTADAAEYYNMPLGVFVDSVAEDSPAAKGGIQPGDIIRKIDGTSVETADNLKEQLSYYEAGEKIEFVVSRTTGGTYEEQTLTIKLGSIKDVKRK